MIVKATNIDTGEQYEMDIPDLKEADVEKMGKEFATDEQILNHIEKLNISAEIKAMLFKFAKFSISVGDKAIKIGKKIIEIVMMLVSKYKMATFGLILGAFLTLLIGSIPILGGILAGFLGPLLMLFGLTKGVWEDLKKSNPDLSGSISEAGSVFSPLKT